MAKIAIVETMARRTPSELRGEQLKRQRCGTPADALLSESLRVPKYIDTRVDEVYPARKLTDKWRMRGEKQKENHVVCSTAAKSYGDENSSKSSNEAGNLRTHENKYNDEASRKVERCSGSTFLTVKQLSVGKERAEGLSNIDMDKALRGLNVREVFDNSASLTDFSVKHGVLSSFSSRKFLSEFHLPGCKSPVDFTLKTSLRLVSSSSVKWFHKLSASWAHSDASSDAVYSKALNTWTYPQSSLPSSLISAMSLSSSQAESSFLLKRQQDWDDSFRSLYYMLRRNLSNIFYVHSVQFIAMFVGGRLLGKKQSVNVYISRSTTGFRSLLREHDVAFTMPLCHSEAVQAGEDDLTELSEIESQNLGQALHLDATSEVDGSPQSLLAFIGNHNAHALYDFLLNHRHLCPSAAGVDVPTLYSPVPFPNASASIPEVRCREMKRAEADEGNPMSYSIEIKDSILPPWVVSRLCAAMGARLTTFHSSFTTEPTSIGLNVAVDSIFGKSTPPRVPEELTPLPGISLGFPEAVVAPQLRSAFLTELKYGDGSYAVHLSPL